MAEYTPKELRAKVLAQITSEPDTHDQYVWETVTSCGTSRCVAGWALHFAYRGAGNAQALRADEADLGGIHRAVAIHTRTQPHILSTDRTSVIAWDLLGPGTGLSLDEVEDELFFGSNAQAVKLLTNMVEKDQEEVSA